MDNVIIIEVKNVYGNDLVYCVSEHAESLYLLTGKKTLKEYDIVALKRLGFKIEQKTKVF